MVAYLKKNRRVAFVVLALLLFVPIAVIAGDNLFEGADDVSNEKTGDIIYPRPSCWDGTNWDRVTCGANLEHAKVDDDSIANCDDLAAASEQYTLPTSGDYYEIRVEGNCASILCGTNPTATTAKNGHWIKVCDGVPFRGRLSGAKCAHIAPSAAGEICYIHFNSAL